MASHGCGGDRCCTFCPPRGRRIICSYGRHFGSCTCGDGDLAFLVMGMSDEMSAMMSLSMMALLLLSISLFGGSYCCHFNGSAFDCQSDVISRVIQVTGREISECVNEMELVVPGCYILYFAWSL